MTLLVLSMAAFLTSALSGIIGMGGGMLLLATMFCFLSHAETIPTHAAVQLVANSTRTVAFLPYVDWRTVGRFALGVLPGGVMGVAAVFFLGEPGAREPYLKALVGLYILASLAVPAPSGARAGTWWDFPLLGLVAGAAAFSVGAVGPLIAPLFARRDFVKERLVATKSVCQALLHVVKIPVFLLLGSFESLGRLGMLALVMAVLVIPGTLLGRRLLRHVSERQFVRLYQLALLGAGLKVLIADGIWPILRAA